MSSKSPQRQIQLKPQHPRIAEKISNEHGVSEIASRVLAARGFNVGEALSQYLDPTLKSGLLPPDQLLNLREACKLIREVIAAKKPIAVCCDYDVDGLTGGAQLTHFLRSIGVVVTAMTPDRFEEGYGLNRRMVEQAKAANCVLLITIDFGTTSHAELAYAKELGLKTIVVDHHHIGEASLPPVDIIINPHQSGCKFANCTLSASGLTWYLLLGLKEALVDLIPAVKGIDVRNYLDLASLGTICDMVPLIGVNRVIARRGLEMLEFTNRPGLVALKNVAGLKKKVTCYDISFALGPRLNAAGRMVSGELVLDLLTTSESNLASKIATRLNKLNVERQETELIVKEESIKYLLSRYPDALPSGLIVFDKKFHMGVVGIVAQRLVEAFYRPSVVLGCDKDGTLKGSVRGVRGFSVVKALESSSKHLLKFGGHDAAGGLSLAPEKFEKFEKAFQDYCSRIFADNPPQPLSEADTSADLSEITRQIVDEFDSFAPFGVGNPSPHLLIESVEVHNVSDIKRTHTKAVLHNGRTFLAGMLWREVNHPLLQKGQKIDVVIKPDYNNFRGVSELQGTIQAMRVAGGK